MVEPSKFLKTNEAAKYLGVSRSSMTNWIRQGLLAGGVTPGGHYRFSIEQLDEFARNRGLRPKEVNTSVTPTRILIVDDDEGFREFVKDALDVFSGYELKEAEDGLKGAMLVGSWKPDLILLDVRMPGMDGGEMLKLIRENPETADTNVLIASAHLSEDLKHELEKMEPDGILEKPVHLAKLIASVQKLVDLQIV